jgi:hypothetical protein
MDDRDGAGLGSPILPAISYPATLLWVSVGLYWGVGGAALCASVVWGIFVSPLLWGDEPQVSFMAAIIGGLIGHGWAALATQRSVHTAGILRDRFLGKLVGLPATSGADVDSARRIAAERGRWPARLRRRRVYGP